MIWPLSKSNHFWQHENKSNQERCPWNNSWNTKLIKYSQKRDAKLEQIRKSSEGQLRCGIRLLWPKRWTIRADAMTSIISNDSVLHELWDWSLNTSTLLEMKAVIRVEYKYTCSNSSSFWLGVGSQSAPAYWQLECVYAKKVVFCSWRSSYGCHDHQHIDEHDSRWYICTVLEWCNHTGRT